MTLLSAPGVRSVDRPRQERTAQAHFFLLGVAILLPWNSFITAVDYFSDVFPGYHVDRVLSVAYMSVNIVSIALNIGAQSFFAQKHVSARARTLIGLVGYVVALLAVQLADAAYGAGARGRRGYMAVLVAGVMLAAFWDGVAQPAVFGEAGEMPLSCVQVRATAARAFCDKASPEICCVAAHGRWFGRAQGYLARPSSRF
jgi:hypothetical protein